MKINLQNISLFLWLLRFRLDLFTRIFLTQQLWKIDTRFQQTMIWCYVNHFHNMCVYHGNGTRLSMWSHKFVQILEIFVWWPNKQPQIQLVRALSLIKIVIIKPSPLFLHSHPICMNCLKMIQPHHLINYNYNYIQPYKKTTERLYLLVQK